MFFGKFLPAWLACSTKPAVSHFEPVENIDHRDPYFRQAEELRALAQSAKLVSSVDGNPAALLNMVSSGRWRAA